MLKSEAENHDAFLSPRRRDQIRIVLEYLGIPATMGNYRRYESTINWEQFAFNIQNPSRMALVDIVDQEGRRCGQTVIDIPEKIKKIPAGYKFIKYL